MDADGSWHMQPTIGKITALVLAIAFVIAVWVGQGDLSLALMVAVGVLFPLALIWFPAEVESWTRSSWSRGVHAVTMNPSPSWLVAVMGWVLLLGFPLFFLLR
jgi:hypothetical protein